MDRNISDLFVFMHEKNTDWYLYVCNTITEA